MQNLSDAISAQPVSPKPKIGRCRALGLLLLEETQVLWLDTPMSMTRLWALIGESLLHT